MSKLGCPCGNLISNCASPNEVEGYLFTDMDVEMDKLDPYRDAREDRAKKLERKEPRLVIDWESMCKDRDKAIEGLESALRNTYEALKDPAFVRCTRCGWQESTSDLDVMGLYIKPALGIE